MLRKIYLRGVVAVLLMASLAQAAHAQLKAAQASPVLVRPNPAATRAPVQLRPGEAAVTMTVVPELYWQTQRNAEYLLGQSHLQFKVSGQGEGQIVVHQEPLPESKVPIGSVVTFTLGQPQLLLSADQLKAAINTNINFTATLEPPLPQTTSPVGTMAAYIPPKLQANYTFYWDDNSHTGPTPQERQPHSYTAPKTYNVFATAQVGNYPIKSNLVSVTVPGPTPVRPSYTVNLQVKPRAVETGKEVQATIAATPPPGPDAAYKIDWGDGTQEVHNLPIATHKYSPPARKRAVHATVTDANGDFHSNAISVEVRTPEPAQPEQPQPKPTPFNPWPLVIGIVVAAGVLLAVGYRLLRRPRKLPRLPQALSINGNRGLANYEIQRPEQIRRVAAVRVVSGCTSSVSMTPQHGINRKRSASNA